MIRPVVSPPKTSPVITYGCLPLVGALLLGVAYLLCSPATPPSGAFLVDAHERTYLATEPFVHGEGFLDPQPYWTLDVTYLKLGGWFESTTYANWGRMPTTTSAGVSSQIIPPVTFTRLPVGEDSVVRISIGCETCMGMLFIKPKTFPGTEADPPAAASPAVPPVYNKVYTCVEHLPGLTGIEGLATLATTIERRLVRPAQAPHGRVLVRLVVTRQGEVTGSRAPQQGGKLTWPAWPSAARGRRRQWSRG